jgi:opacity protein-like surface antigen
MKKTTLLIFALFIASTAFAQKGAMKIEPSLVLTTSYTGTGMGFGGNGTFFYGINKNIDLTATLGYLHWSYDAIDGSRSSVPLLFGARYSFVTNGALTPYASAEIGIHFINDSYEIPGIAGWTAAQTISASSTEFGIGLGGGAYYNLGNIILDGNLQFNSIDGSIFSFEIGALFAL